MENVVVQNEKHVSQYLKFQVPTPITKLNPVFLFTFYPDALGKKNIDFDVTLNPELYSGMTVLRKHYRFNQEGNCKVSHNAGDGYFIEGDIAYLTNDQECFLNITYGKNNDALHFIKGKFKLNH